MPNFHPFLSSHYPSLGSLVLIALTTPSFHILLGLPRFFQYGGIHCKTFLGSLDSSIRWTWKYRISCFRSMSFVSDTSTLILHRISSFRILSSLDIPSDLLKTSVSFASSFLRSLSMIFHVSDPYERGLVIKVLYISLWSIGRRRHSWLKHLREWFNATNSHLFRAAVSKIRIALMIANLRNEDGTWRRYFPISLLHSLSYSFFNFSIIASGGVKFNSQVRIIIAGCNFSSVKLDILHFCAYWKVLGFLYIQFQAPIFIFFLYLPGHVFEIILIVSNNNFWSSPNCNVYRRVSPKSLPMYETVLVKYNSPVVDPY